MKLAALLPLTLLTLTSLSPIAMGGSRDRPTQILSIPLTSPSLAAPRPAKPSAPKPSLRPTRPQGTTAKRSPLIVLLPKLPSDRGLPGNRSHAASRSCIPWPRTVPPTAQFTVLTPEYKTKPNQTQVWALTQASQPTLWVHLPWAKPDIASLSLVLVSDRGATLREMDVPMPEQPGIFPVVLDHPLAVGDRYQWNLILVPKCSPMEMILRSGWVERQMLNGSSVSTSSLNQPSLGQPSLGQPSLNQSSPSSQARFYAAQGFWLDALSTLAQARLATPNTSEFGGVNRDLQQDWTDLLTAVQLEAYAKQSLHPRNDLDHPAYRVKTKLSRRWKSASGPG